MRKFICFALVAMSLASVAGGSAMARPVHDRWYQDIESPYQGLNPNSSKGNWAFWDNMNGVSEAH
jgi:hypothetical protein